MGALITKGKGVGEKGGASDGASSGAYAPGTQGIGPDGVLKDPVVEGILNLENKQITVEIFAKIATIQPVTKQVVSLSLANNRLTAIVFDGDGPGSAASSSALVAAAASSAALLPPSLSRMGTDVFPAPSSGGAGLAALQEDLEESMEDAGPALSGAAPASPLTPTASSAGSSAGGSLSSPSKKFATLVIHPLRSSLSWPLLENLDLSANVDLFNYAGLNNIGATLRSLRLANNGIFKVPREVWSLANLTKLDLSHNRLISLPAGVCMLTQLHSLKLSHNSLTATTSTSCIPEELRLCTRLRRLDLSHNKLKELPVNWSADKQTQLQRKSVLTARASVERARSGSNPTPPDSQPLMPSDGSSPMLAPAKSGKPGGLRGGAGFGKVDPSMLPPAAMAGAAAAAGGSPIAGPVSSPPLTSGAAPAASSSATLSSSPSSSSLSQQASIPIKYFDPARISYIGLTLLN